MKASPYRTIQIIYSLLTVFSLFSTSATLASPESIFEKTKTNYLNQKSSNYFLLPHKGNYILPVVYNANPNTELYEPLESDPRTQDRGQFNKEYEAEFQISFAISTTEDIFGSDHDIFIAYTQRAWWQLYNSDWSRQFREINYQPEIFVRKDFLEKERSFLGGRILLYDVGLIHESNGEIQELTRSWNRFYARFYLMYGTTFIMPTIWYRLPEDEEDDENSDILEYLGYGELRLSSSHRYGRFGLRVIPGTKSWGAELDYSLNFKKGLRWYLKIGVGTGLSLLDYDIPTTKVGLGFTLTDLTTAYDEN